MFNSTVFFCLKTDAVEQVRDSERSVRVLDVDLLLVADADAPVDAEEGHAVPGAVGALRVVQPVPADRRSHRQAERGGGDGRAGQQDARLAGHVRLVGARQVVLAGFGVVPASTRHPV